MASGTAAAMGGVLGLEGPLGDSSAPRHAQKASAARTPLFWGLVVATGAAAGLGAVALEKLLKFVQGLVWPRSASLLESVAAASPLHRVLVLGGAGLLVTVASLIARKPLGGHGTANIIEAVWIRAGDLPLGRTVARALLSIVGVAMGVSLGREGALIQTGAATGAWLGRRGRISTSQVRLLVACGAAAGVAAAYNAPLGAAVFGLEVFLGSFALELLGPIAISTAISTAVARALLGAHTVYAIPHYELLDPLDLVRALPIGAIVGVASAGFIRVIDSVPRQVERLPRAARFALPTVATLLVGGIAVGFPQVLGNGYDTVNAALLGRVPLMLLLTLPLLKLVTTASCSGSGVPGGLFTPSLFFGGLLGAAAGTLINHFLPAPAPTAVWALLGMAAVLAGTTHAVASAVLLVFELTGDYSVILPLMAAAVVAAMVSRALTPHSLYAAGLRRRNLTVELPRPEWLRVTEVRAVVREQAGAVGPGTPFSDLVLRLLSSPESDLYVIRNDGRLLGIVSLGALKAHLGDGQDLPMVVAADVMDAATEPLTPDTPLADAAARFAETGFERLPVVDGARRLLGSVGRADLLRRGRF